MSEEAKQGSTVLASSLIPGSPDAPDGHLSDASEPSVHPDWEALLNAIAEAPNVDPAPFVRLPSEKHVMLGRRLGHFRILDRLGEGGMGIVYKAEDESLRRPVALKVLRPRFLEDEAQHQRLVREAQSAAAFNHPNIAAIYEIGQANGMAFIAMEYVDGKPLRSVLQKRHPSEAEVLQYATEIARGLARAHSAGIVHRDLKPENLLVDPDGHVKILDFGLAKPVEPVSADERQIPAIANEWEPTFATQDGQILGTPVYMSPEQAEGKPVDARSDVYSFGVVLHELLTGRVPRRGEPLKSPEALPSFTLNDTVPASFARAELMQIAQRCLYAGKEDRFADGRELLSALERVGTPRVNSKAVRNPHHRRVRWEMQLLGVAVVVLSAGAVLWYGGRPLSRAVAGLRTHTPGSGLLYRRIVLNPLGNMIKDAAISPDGSKLAYTDQTGLFLRSLESADLEHVAFPKDVAPIAVSWFPDGKSLFVTALEQDLVHATIWTVAPPQKAKKLSDSVFDIEPYLQPRLSPDGTAYAWIDSKKGIYWKTVDGARTQLVIPSAEGDAFQNVTWSPDSRRIAYVRLREAKKGPQPFIESVDLSGTPPRILVQRQDLIQEQGEAALGWMPDGRLIYGVAEVPPKEPGTTLWELRVDLQTGEPKGEPMLLGSSTGPIEGTLSVSNKGTVLFQRCVGRMTMLIADLIDEGKRLGPVRRLTSTARDARPTDWSPDGRNIAFMTDQDGGQQVFLIDVESSNVRLVTSGPYWHTWPRFTGDGLLLFWQLPPAPNEEPSQMELMRLQGKEAKPAQVFAAGLPVRFKRNGRPPPRNVQFRCGRQSSCVYSEVVWNQLQFASFDPRSGTGRELMRIDAESTPRFVDWDLSPDGSQIAVPLGTAGLVRIFELSSGKSTDRQIGVGCNVQFASWRSDGKAIFVTAMCAGENQYKLFLSELNGTTHLLRESPNEWMGNLVAGPEQNRLVFAAKPLDVDVWLLDGF